MKLSRIQGIVLKEVYTGEADKIITIFTKRLGKVQAFAKGSRRPQSRLIAGTQFLSFSDFVLFQGKDMYTIRNCDLIESFYNIRTSLDKLTYASHVVDIISDVSEENLSYPKLTQLLLNTLHMLANTDKSPELIIRIFEVRLMSTIGFTPEVVECLNCRNVSGDEVLFSAKLGGIICKSCGISDKSAFKISQGALNALRYIIYSDIKKIFSFDVSESVLNEISRISDKFMMEHLGRKFNKLKFLETLEVGNNNE